MSRANDIKRIALVSMPFGPIAYPSVGISLLAEAVRKQGIGCDIHYLNLAFAARIGLENFVAISELSPATALAGEWLFSSHAVDDQHSSEYIETVLLEKYSTFFTVDVVLQMFNMRDAAGAFLDHCMSHMDWASYSMIGFTTTFQQNMASLALARRIKRLSPDCTIVFGGANCEGEMGEALHRNFDFIDYVCSGEGDKAFLDLLSWRNNPDRQVPAIDGILARDANGTRFLGKEVSPVENLDELPYPSYEEYFVQLRATKLDRFIEPVIPFETSRGCWWGAKSHCTFCGLNGQTMRFRSKSQERAVREVQYLAERYGDTFLCVDNIFDLHYLERFFPDIASQDRRLKFHFETKVNLKKDQLRLLRQAGVTHLQPGIESLSTPILKLMRKGTTRLQNIRFLRWARQLGITAVWNLLYGFPGEDVSEYEEMATFMPLLHHLDPPIFVTPIRMDRHSPYFNTPDRFGLRNVRPYPAYQLLYNLPDEEVRKIAYYFEFDDLTTARPQDRLERFFETAHQWQSESADTIELRASRRADGSVCIFDTREVGVEKNYDLDTLAGQLLWECDSERKLEGLYERYEPHSIDRIDLALSELKERGLTITDGDHVLSLPVLRENDSDQRLQKPGAAALRAAHFTVLSGRVNLQAFESGGRRKPTEELVKEVN